MAGRRILQINLNHCRVARNAMWQMVAELEAGLVVASEMYGEVGPGDLASGDGAVALLLGRRSAYLPPSLVEAGRGYVAAEWGPIVVVGVYFTPNERRAEFERRLDGIGDLIRRCRPRPTVVLGDFNARSAVWADCVTNARGRSVSSWAAELDLRVLNEGAAETCIRANGGSIVDLSFATPSALPLLGGWRVHVDRETLSDHRYILMQVIGVRRAVGRATAIAESSRRTGSGGQSGPSTGTA